jgi:hypothetical protein
MSLPGGLGVVIHAGSTPAVSSARTYPNLHGDNILTADATGVRQADTLNRPGFSGGRGTASATNYPCQTSDARQGELGSWALPRS